MWWIVKSTLLGIAGGKLYDVVQGIKRYKHFKKLNKRARFSTYKKLPKKKKRRNSI